MESTLNTCKGHLQPPRCEQSPKLPRATAAMAAHPRHTRTGHLQPPRCKHAPTQFGAATHAVRSRPEHRSPAASALRTHFCATPSCSHHGNQQTRTRAQATCNPHAANTHQWNLELQPSWQSAQHASTGHLQSPRCERVAAIMAVHPAHEHRSHTALALQPNPHELH